MQQRNSTGGPSSRRPPNEGYSGQPQVLKQAFDAFAPGVAEACPEMVETARACIFQQGARRHRRRLRALLEGCSPQGLIVERELLLTALEGLAAIRAAHGLATEAELDAFMQGHKEAFRLRL